MTDDLEYQEVQLRRRLLFRLLQRFDFDAPNLQHQAITATTSGAWSCDDVDRFMTNADQSPTQMLRA
ncbi:hypothetical protein [Pacificibacter maritimus]|nr:hypothetical protein [Pacificibacter maritimus]